jgi:hypothetical protein
MRPAVKGPVHNRHTIVIDETSGRRPNGHTASGAAARETVPPRLGGLVHRFMRVLRGD